MEQPLEDLVGQAKQGHARAADELIQRTYQRVYAWLRRLCQDDQEASDLTQKTFSRAWQSLDSFRGNSSFPTWLHGIAYHVYVDWRRKQQRNPNQTLPWWEDQTDQSADPFESAAERDQAFRLYELVETLDDDARVTVQLHYYQGLTLDETAQALGLATSTIKYRLHHALDLLKSRFTKLNAIET